MADVILSMLESGQRDMEWFSSSFGELKDKYNDRFVAFSGKKIIDSDKDVEALLSRLSSKGIDTSKVFIEFISSVKSIL